MLKYKYFFILISFIFFIYSCEYEPNGTYNVIINQYTVPPTLSVYLNFNEDTLFIPLDTDITFEFKAEDDLVNTSIFSINDKQIAIINNNTGSFNTSFSSSKYNQGVGNIFEVSFIRRSGSNSLADKLGKEVFKYTKNFTVIFKGENFINNIPEIKSIKPENGSLKITWEKYTGVGFKKYIVWSGTNDIAGIFYDQNITSCFDSTFIGYRTDYHILTQTNSDNYISKTITFEDQLPQIRLKKINDDSILLSWGKSKYISNISNYRIFEGFEITNKIVTEIAKFDINSVDTSFVFADGKFGVKSKYYLLPTRRKNPQQINERQDLDSYASQTQFHYFGTSLVGGYFVNTPIGEYAYFVKSSNNQDFVIKYKCTLDQYIDSIPYYGGGVKTTPNGDKLFIHTKGKIQEYDTKTMTETRVIELSKLSDLDSSQFLHDYLISNNGIGVYVSMIGYYVFFDFINAQELGRFRIDGSTNDSDQRSISADGQFFCTRHLKGLWPSYLTELYQLKNSVVSKIWSDTEVRYFEMDKRSNILAFLKKNKLYLLSMDNLKVISELDVADPNFLNIDWNNREYLTLNEARNLLSVYNMDSGQLKIQKKTISYDNSELTFQNLKLFNKTLFTLDLRMHLNY